MRLNVYSPLYIVLGTDFQWRWVWWWCRTRLNPKTTTECLWYALCLFITTHMRLGRKLAHHKSYFKNTFNCSILTANIVNNSQKTTKFKYVMLSSRHSPEGATRNQPRPSHDSDSSHFGFGFVDNQSLWLWSSRRTQCWCRLTDKLSHGWRPSCMTRISERNIL